MGEKKLDKETVALSAALVIVVLLLGYSVLSSFSAFDAGDDVRSVDVGSGAVAGYETKKDSGEVSVALTPKKFSDGKFYVDYGIETHTFNGLDKIDLKEVVSLEFDGVSVKPIEAPTMGGHHNFGTLVFEVDSEPTSFKITVREIPDIALRVFEW